MPSSAVRGFSDPDEYAATVRGGAVGLTVAARGDFSAKLTRIDLHRLWMQRFADNLPRVCEVSRLVGGRAYITFRTRAGPSLLQSGLEIDPTAILRHGRSSDYFQRSSGAASFATMSLPIEDMASIGEAVGERDLFPTSDATLVIPRPAAMARLQRLHAAAGQLAEGAAEIIANPDAARGLEQALIEALTECLGGQEKQPSLPAQGQHALVMRRFRRVLEENPEQPIYIPEICKAIRASERTLRICCQEHLGMSPKRYLVLRRMRLARRTLSDATVDATTVTDVATHYGFWQLGRFAVEYRSLFGEPPSVTLRRQPAYRASAAVRCAETA